MRSVGDSINSDSPQLEFCPNFYVFLPPFAWWFQAPLYLWVPSAFAHHRCGNHGFLCISAILWGNCCRASKIFGVQKMCRCVGEVCETGPLLDASSTVMLTSVQLLCNKVDELWASGKFLIQCNSPCVLAITKTLLRNKTDSDLEVDGFGKLFLLVRDSSETSKSLSGGLCLYGNKNWCNTDY